MKIGKVKIYDYIGEGGVTARDVLDTVEHLEGQGCKKFKLDIYSRGGDLYEGLAIYNIFIDRETQVVISGIAASMASVIAMAGNEILIYKNSSFLPHNPWGLRIGDYKAFADAAEELRKHRDTLVQIYKERTGKEEDDLKALLDTDKSLTAKEAIDNKFADGYADGTDEKTQKAIYSEIYDDNNQPNSEDIMLKKILAQLGFTDAEIEAGVSDEAVQARWDKFQVANLESSTDDFKALNDKVVALQTELTTLKTKNADEDAAKVLAAATEKAETLVDAAISDFKIEAAQKDSYVRSAVADFDATKAELEAIKKDSVKENLNKGKTLDQTDPIALAAAINKYKNEQEKAGTVLSYSQAARIVCG